MLGASFRTSSSTWKATSTSPTTAASRAAARNPEPTTPQKIANVALVVSNYDEAIAYYTEKLGFELIEDTALSETKRFVLVRPPGSSGSTGATDSTGTNLLLAQAASPEQASRVGNQTGGRVFLFLHTDDFWRDYNAMREAGVAFIEEPRQETYGTVVVFDDLYGNRWDLVEAPKASSA